MTKSEQLLARRSSHSKDFLHFVFFFPIDFVIVNPELSQWTIEKSDSFVRNKDYKHSEMVFSAIPFLKKKGCLQLPWFQKDQFTNFHWLYSISSFLHPEGRTDKCSTTDIGETVGFWPFQAWQGSKRGHEKSHLAGKRP